MRPDPASTLSYRSRSSASGSPGIWVAVVAALSMSASILAAADFSPFDFASGPAERVIAQPVRSAVGRKVPVWLRAKIFETGPYCPSANAWASGSPLPPR